MRLRDYLRVRGETQRAFAARSGIPYSTIQDICQGGGTLTTTALKIQELTDRMVKVEDLVPEENDGMGGSSGRDSSRLDPALESS